MDGIAGKQTQHALFGTVEPGADDYTDYNFQFYPAEKIDWYTGGIQQLWAKGASYKIYDVKTGIGLVGRAAGRVTATRTLSP